MAIFTTEITSDKILSDNPLHQRLLFPYYEATKFAKGKILEIGCGEGRGVEILHNISQNYTGVDKINSAIKKLKEKYPSETYQFYCDNVPPIKRFEREIFDTVIAFQVIEHIQDDVFFLKEIYRILKPGGICLLTTPNIKKSLSRNPWHVREYTANQLLNLAKQIFPHIDLWGVGGNYKVWKYYEENKISVQRIMKWDFLDLQYKLPASVLKIPYELLNRLNRNKIKQRQSKLVEDISYKDYYLDKDPDKNLDLFMVCYK